MRLIDADNAWGIGILQDWYIHSVNPDDIPQWTDEHIEELCKDFYVIPKETAKYDIDCNLDRLKELTQADKEGRCLIFPAGFEFENGMNTKTKDVSGFVFDNNRQTMKLTTITARVIKDDRGTTMSLADEVGTGIMLVVPVEKIKEMLR